MRRILKNFDTAYILFCHHITVNLCYHIIENNTETKVIFDHDLFCHELFRNTAESEGHYGPLEKHATTMLHSDSFGILK